MSLKLTNGSAGLSTDTIDTLGGSKGKLTLQNGGMTVTIPGGFGKVNEPGRIYFPFDYEDAPPLRRRYAGRCQGGERQERGP